MGLPVYVYAKGKRPIGKGQEVWEWGVKVHPKVRAELMRRRENRINQAHGASGALPGRDAPALETLTAQALRFETGGGEPAETCLAFAALQVCWVRMSGALEQPPAEKVSDRTGGCPVCGSPPVASVVHSEGSLAGTRFVVCSLCATEWHLVRIKCVNCHSTKGIGYLEVDGAGGVVKAETCDECRTYTKIIYTEKAPRAEAFADDLASLALDVLVSEAGWQRAAPNPFLIPGDL